MAKMKFCKSVSTVILIGLFFSKPGMAASHGMCSLILSGTSVFSSDYKKLKEPYRELAAGTSAADIKLILDLFSKTDTGLHDDSLLLIKCIYLGLVRDVDFANVDFFRFQGKEHIQDLVKKANLQLPASGAGAKSVRNLVLSNVAVQLAWYFLGLNPFIPVGSEIPANLFLPVAGYWISTGLTNLWAGQSLARAFETKKQKLSLDQISQVLEGKKKLKDSEGIYFSGNFGFDHLEFLFIEVDGKSTLNIIRWRYRKASDP